MRPAPPAPVRRRGVGRCELSLLCLALFVVCLPQPGLRAQHAEASPVALAAYAEHELKAAYLFHFASYVEWPPPQDAQPIVIAVLSAPDVAQALARFADGRTILDRRVRVREIHSARELAGAEVLFVGGRANRSLRTLATALPVGTLLVSEASDGLANGAMINFRLVERRVRFEVSLRATHAAGLKLSSRLLSVAMHVDTPP